MKTFASVAFLALVAPIFAVPFEQLEARKYYDDNTSSASVFPTEIAAPTTQVPYIRPFESLIPSQLTIVPSATSHRGPHHTGATEDGERRHTRSGHPFPSGTGFPHESGFAHHTHHTHTHTQTESYFKLHPTGTPDDGYENRISSFRFNAVTNLIHSHHTY